MDADAGVEHAEPEADSSKGSIENNAKESLDSDGATEVDAKKKPKKEKIGFRDRKV